MRVLYIIENIEDSHYKLNFNWSDEVKQEWKKKLDLIKEKSKYTISNNKKSNSSSKYLGVSPTYGGKLFEIKVKGKYIGIHKNEESAARKRDLYVMEIIKIHI